MIELFEHNQVAYDAAVAMLDDTGKAAIVHPTGTGKSFIGFKLCEEHPDKVICWLSPSEYIFKTQLENFEAPEIMTYSLESTIAEKLDAILQRFELTGRMKDFYDTFYQCQCCQ